MTGWWGRVICVSVGSINGWWGRVGSMEGWWGVIWCSVFGGRNRGIFGGMMKWGRWVWKCLRCSKLVRNFGSKGGMCDYGVGVGMGYVK